MAQATKNSPTAYASGVDPILISRPVKAGVAIFAGHRLSIDANGFVKILAGADTLFVGTAEEAADNTAGADGAISVLIRQQAEEEVPSIGAYNSADDVNKPVYAQNGSDLSDSPTSAIQIGKVTHYSPTTGKFSFFWQGSTVRSI